MENYPKMYAVLCAAASDAIDLIEAGRPLDAAALLQRALDTAEELYLAPSDPSVTS